MKRGSIIVMMIALCMTAVALISFMDAVMTGRVRMENFMSMRGNLELANSQAISVSQIDNIEISYRSDSITFYQGESEAVVLEEYMNRWEESIPATVTSADGVISIEGGQRPAVNLIGRFRTHIKVYLPQSYRGSLNASVSSGSIKLELPENLGFMLKINTNSGSIHTDFDDQLSFNKKGNSADGQIGNGGGPAIELTASSGSVRVIQ